MMENKIAVETGRKIVNMTGESRGISGMIAGNFVNIRDDRDALMVDLKLQGKSNSEIARITEMNLKTVQNSLSKGGRLFPALQVMKAQKSAIVDQGNLSTWEKLCAAKDPAIEELRRIANEDPDARTRLLAIKMILDQTGIRESDRPPLLDPANQEESAQRFIEWADKLFLDAFRARAPKPIIVNRVSFGTLEGCIDAYCYGQEKFLHWIHADNEDEFREFLEASVKDVSKMDAQLQKYEFPIDPWEWKIEDPEKALVFKQLIEKSHEKRQKALEGLAAEILGNCGDAIAERKELLSEDQKQAKESVKEILNSGQKVN